MNAAFPPGSAATVAPAMVSTPATSGERLSARELQAWRGLLRAHAALRRVLDADLEREHGLALTSYEVFLFLEDAEDGHIRLHDLADRIMLSRSGLTRLVDRLERDGFVARESCPTDGRGSYARLTDAGRAKLAAARRTHLAGVRRCFLDHLTAEEQMLLGDVWERVLPDGAAQCPGSCG